MLAWPHARYFFCRKGHKNIYELERKVILKIQSWINEIKFKKRDKKYENRFDFILYLILSSCKL